MPTHAAAEDFTAAVLRAGHRLGWASLAVVLAGLALEADPRHLWLPVGATLAAAAANAAAMVIPWRDWLASRRGRLLLDLWCGGLVAFVALLVTSAGPAFTVLLFLVVPFVAVVQTGRRRGFWLAVSAATCTVVAALLRSSADATAIRLMLVAVVAAGAFLLVRAIRRASARAALERVRAQEASHRIKNDLQTAADLLLLARPEGADGEAFDDTAGRIRAIATVHRLLSAAPDRIGGDVLLRSITAGAPLPVEIAADETTFEAETAQRLGIVANELVANAIRHGSPPIRVRLEAGEETRLLVEDAGGGRTRPDGSGNGLRLVRRLVEQGLNGRFELRADGVGTRAEVVFPTRSR